MNATLINAQASIAKLCAIYGVRSLDAFDSATQSAAPNEFDFIVDLVSASAMSNPYFAKNVAATRTPIYAPAST
jgi:hypothetical protein